MPTFLQNVQNFLKVWGKLDLGDAKTAQKLALNTLSRKCCPAIFYRPSHPTALATALAYQGWIRLHVLLHLWQAKIATTEMVPSLPTQTKIMIWSTKQQECPTTPTMASTAPAKRADPPPPPSRTRRRSPEGMVSCPSLFKFVAGAGAIWPLSAA